ncbi:MAG: TerC family protein [Pyrinomonadaceae bacterium]|nr:TerC family protein [Pyrinomonadaceae bacterium]
MENGVWAWVGFGAFILLMLVLDLGLLNRKAHAIKYREAAVWSAVWVTLALMFAGLIYFAPHFFNIPAEQAGLKLKEFITGYLIELSLSVDNLFVFLLIFSYFKVPAKYQHRVLFWGVLGALVMRITMILLGTALINNFHWIIYVFGAFLVYTGIKMMRQQETDINPEENPLVRFVTRYVRITRHYEEDRFFTSVNGHRTGTLLLLVLIIVEVTDLVFAVDSIPAIFGITTDPFIVYTSNVFAILGLRSLYFLLAGVIEKFHYLKIGLAIVLTFIGAKMLSEAAHIKISIGISLGVVSSVLLLAVVASLLWPEEAETDCEVDLPPEFDPPAFGQADDEEDVEEPTNAVGGDARK